jgi:hypothetical protein
MAFFPGRSVFGDKLKDGRLVDHGQCAILTHIRLAFSASNYPSSIEVGIRDSSFAS